MLNKPKHTKCHPNKHKIAKTLKLWYYYQWLLVGIFELGLELSLAKEKVIFCLPFKNTNSNAFRICCTHSFDKTICGILINFAITSWSGMIFINYFKSTFWKPKLLFYMAKESFSLKVEQKAPRSGGGQFPYTGVAGLLS